MQVSNAMNTVGISSNALFWNSAGNFFEPFSWCKIFINILSSLLIRLPFCFCLCKNYVKCWRTDNEWCSAGQCFRPVIVFAAYKWCGRFVFGAVNVKLYADDIKIYLEIVDDADIDQLQMGIYSLSAWANTWQLTLAVENAMHLREGLCKSSPDAHYHSVAR